jgi:hypothetical protein
LLLKRTGLEPTSTTAAMPGMFWVTTGTMSLGIDASSSENTQTCKPAGAASWSPGPPTDGAHSSPVTRTENS